LKKYVLSPAKKEICEKTDISIEIEEKKRGRKVIGLIFYITGKERQKTDIYLPKEELEQIPKNKIESVEKLVDMGVTRFVAEQLATEFDKERIERGIAYTKEKNGTLKDPAAFVVVAIQKEYTDSKSKEKEKKVEVLQLQLDQEKLKKEWQKIKSQYEAWKKDAAESILFEMPVETIENYKQQFIASLANNSVILNAIRKNKDTEKRHFLLYMYQHLTLDSLETWAQKNAIDLSVFSNEIRNK
jgi:plasmid replication initiation protein